MRQSRWKVGKPGTTLLYVRLGLKQNQLSSVLLPRGIEDSLVHAASATFKEQISLENEECRWEDIGYLR
jgi:hypothetical protein